MRSEVEEEVDLARRAVLGTLSIAPILAANATRAAHLSPTAGLPPDLARAVSAYDQATLRNDIAVLEKLVADGYVLVNSDATVQRKQEYLADFNLPGFRIDPYVLEHPVLNVWGDVALIAGRLQLKWTQDGKRHARVLRIAHIWVKHDERWRMTYTQLTRAPE